MSRFESNARGADQHFVSSPVDLNRKKVHISQGPTGFGIKVPGEKRIPRLQELNGFETVDAAGLTVAPGLIDMHVHLREPGQGYKETIASGTTAAAAGGFTAVGAMPNTLPVNDSPEITRWMLAPERGAQIRVFPIAAATRGSKGEAINDFAALKSAGAVAVSDDGLPILKDGIMRETLAAAARVGLSVIQHAEDTRMTQGASMNAGTTAFKLGLRGWPAEAESSLVERDIRLVQELRDARVHYHVAHISTAAAVAAVRQARRNGLRVTCEVAPHHFLLTEEHVGMYSTHAKMCPPLRSAADRDAMIEAILDGVVDAIATDHAPHATHEKEVEFERAPNGITGLETALGLCLRWLHKEWKLPLGRVLSLMSAQPAALLGLKGRGSLAVGSFGDVVIFDPKAEWVYRAAETKSKSRNTPFDGWTMQGKVRWTISEGKIAYASE